MVTCLLILLDGVVAVKKGGTYRFRVEKIVMFGFLHKI